MSPLDVAAFAVDSAVAERINHIDASERMPYLRRVAARVDDLYASGDAAGLRDLCVAVQEEGPDVSDTWGVDYYHELEVGA